MISKGNKQLLTIITLMLITGFIIYHVYFKIEGFETTTTAGQTTTTAGQTSTTSGQKSTTAAQTTTTTGCPVITVPIVYKSIISKPFGIGFNIDKLNDKYFINHIPINNKGVIGSVYAIDQDGLLTLKVRNNNDDTQKWTIEKIGTTNDYLAKPSTRNNTALQYANGILAVRPLDTASDNSSFKWILSEKEVERGIPVLNITPIGLFGTEFNPLAAVSTSGMSQESITQVNDVLNIVKTSIQQFLNNAANNTPSYGGTGISGSTLGTKESPLSISLNLGKAMGTEKFDSVQTEVSDVLNLLDRYDSTKNPNTEYLYSLSDISKDLKGCKNINLSDYTSNRVSTCNCKL